MTRAAWTAVFLTLLSAGLLAAKTYYYDIDSSENRSREKMVITEKNGLTEYKWFRADGTRSYYVKYTNRTEVVEAVIPESNTNFLRLVFDRAAGKIVWSGRINAEIPILTNAILDKSVFHVFTHVYPVSNEVLYFQMIQPADVRVIDMYLRQDGTETLELNGRRYQTVRYEFGVANPFAALFWPYKYYYWMTSGDRRVVKHTGVEANLSNETITLYER